MNVTIIGTGYVGLVTGTCFSELGNDVVCLDVDIKKIQALNSGLLPIYEPGLEELVKRNRTAGRLIFSTDVPMAVAHGEVLIIAVGTPPNENGAADLTHVLEVARKIGRYINGSKIVVNKSTVPVGTAEKVESAIWAEIHRNVGYKSLEEKNNNVPPVSFVVVSNPEFLKEGAAVEDFMRPDRIVIGVPPSEQRAVEIMRTLYAPFNRNHDKIQWMDVKSAELTKYAANAMLATRISFMNELANLAEKVGADIELVRKGIGSDPRIGFGFLYAGVGYGGSCFPKDVQALIRTADQYASRLGVLEAVDSANSAQKAILVKKIIRKFGPDLNGMHFAIWGLAFKPNTDDMREAPSRVVVRELLKSGATISVYDPIATENAKSCLSNDLSDFPSLLSKLEYSHSALSCLDGADALVIVTDWKEFKSKDLSDIKHRLNAPVIFDGRNLYDPREVNELGIEYYSIGRTLGNSEISK